jgi:hypothetical protein
MCSCSSADCGYVHVHIHHLRGPATEVIVFEQPVPPSVMPRLQESDVTWPRIGVSE